MLSSDWPLRLLSVVRLLVKDPDLMNVLLGRSAQQHGGRRPFIQILHREKHTHSFKHTAAASHVFCHILKHKMFHLRVVSGLYIEPVHILMMRDDS